LQLWLVAKGEIPLDQGCGVMACLSPQYPSEHRIAPGMGDRRANGHRQAPARREHAPHLTKCGNAVRKKHQSKLAHHHIESAVFEGQFRSIALAPIDLWPQPPSHAHPR
jgi:hypothetical protein